MEALTSVTQVLKLLPKHPRRHANTSPPPEEDKGGARNVVDAEFEESNK